MLPVRAIPVIKHLISSYAIVADVENHEDMSNIDKSC